MKAARYLNVPVPDINEVPMILIDKAINYMNGEGEGEEIRAERKNRKS